MIRANERLWARLLLHVRRAEPPSSCLEWTGHRNLEGYGTVSLSHSKRDLAHRASWMAHYGSIPTSACVLHRCDNPPCINPEHLFLGDRRDNMRDCKAKGRNRIYRGEMNGEGHPSTRFSDATIRAVFEAYAAGGVTQTQLAARFGMSPALVSCITRGVGRRAALEKLKMTGGGA